MLKKAADLKKNDGYIIDSLGWAYFAKKDFIEAYFLFFELSDNEISNNLKYSLISFFVTFPLHLAIPLFQECS